VGILLRGPVIRTRALLLAGGRGSRLRPLTDTVPKCLVPIAGRPLLDYWLESLARAGIREALVNTHHLAQQVRRHLAGAGKESGVRLVESYEPELLGSAGTIRANRSWVDDADECLIVYADNFSEVDLGELLAFHRAHPEALTMMLFHAGDPKSCGIVELDDAGRVTSFVEKPEHPASDLANAGLYVASADAYREIADLDAFDLAHDVLPRFVGRMRGFPFAGYHRDVGSHEALARVNAYAVRRRRPAVFLDRDGTVVEHVHHLTEASKLRLVEGAAEAIRSLRLAGYCCVLVTNQSVVGRGLLSEEGLEAVHAELEARLAEHGARLDGLYYCPQAPRGDEAVAVEHPDRKPGPGMLLRAACELGLDLGASFMIGDSLSDALAGQSAGCRGNVLVKTGLAREDDAAHDAVDHVAADLPAAAAWILSLQEPRSVRRSK